MEAISSHSRLLCGFLTHLVNRSNRTSLCKVKPAERPSSSPNHLYYMPKSDSTIKSSPRSRFNCHSASASQQQYAFDQILLVQQYPQPCLVTLDSSPHVDVERTPPETYIPSQASHSRALSACTHRRSPSLDLSVNSSKKIALSSSVQQHLCSNARS